MKYMCLKFYAFANSSSLKLIASSSLHLFKTFQSILRLLERDCFQD